MSTFAEAAQERKDRLKNRTSMAAPYTISNADALEMARQAVKLQTTLPAHAKKPRATVEELYEEICSGETELYGMPVRVAG